MRWTPAFLIFAAACQSAGASRVAGGLPAVLTGKAKLYCSIDWERDGTQRLQLESGSGVELDVMVSPIVDGTATLKGAQEGGEYRFTSHLARPGTGKISGVGDVEIEALETKVTVGLEGYVQPEGPGTTITFQHDQVSKTGMYVEFLGRARAKDGKRYAFRINFGALENASGEVTPRDADRETRIVAKMVMVEAPINTVIESRSEVTPL